MGKYLESFKKRLKDALDSGVISKAELHRKTGISMSMLYRYLDTSEPGLHSLELIADALECDPRELIKPEDEPIFRPHTLEDCLAVINEAASGKRFTVEMTATEPALREKSSADPDMQELLSLLPSLDQEERRAVLLYVQSLVPSGSSGKIQNRPHKVK